MKLLFLVLVVAALTTLAVFGISASMTAVESGDSMNTLTGQFILGGSLGVEILFILAAVFTGYSLLKRHVVEY